MQKRTKLAILILVAFVLIAIGVWIFSTPLRKQTPQPAVPTNSLPSTTPSGTKQPSQTTVPGTSAPVATPPPTPAQNSELILQNTAKSSVERIGSGTSQDGFLGYQDVLTGVTASERTELLAEQKTMQRSHPQAGPVYGISTRSVSSNVLTGAFGDSTLTILVEAIQSTDAGDPTKPTLTKGKQITVTFVKQDNGLYLIDKIVWSDEAL